jgi:hypothetical protein
MVPTVQSDGTLSPYVLPGEADTLTAGRAGGRNRSTDPRSEPALSEQVHCLGSRIGRQNRYHPDAHIEGSFKIKLGNRAELLDESKDWLRLPCRTVDPHLARAGNDPRQVVREPAARNVAHRMHLDRIDQR